jgi:hypothetical protein
MYFTGPNKNWNWFDFIIVVLCMPFLPFDSFASGLRLFRLMRVLKIMSKIPQLLMILTGLAAGCKAAIWILILLFLFFYMYATAGLMFFKKTDPRSFRDYGRAFTTLYRLSTLEDWTDVMYHAYFVSSLLPRVHSAALYSWPAAGGARGTSEAAATTLAHHKIACSLQLARTCTAHARAPRGQCTTRHVRPRCSCAGMQI